MSRAHEQSGNKLISGFYTKNIDDFLQNIKNDCGKYRQLQHFFYENGTYKRPSDGVLQNTDALTLYVTPTYPTAVVYNNKSNGNIICRELPEGPIIVFSDTKNSISWEPNGLIEKTTDIASKYSSDFPEQSIWFKLGKTEKGSFYPPSQTPTTQPQQTPNPTPAPQQPRTPRKIVPLGCGEGEKNAGTSKCDGGNPRKHQTKNITKRKYKIRKTIRKRKGKKTT